MGWVWRRVVSERARWVGGWMRGVEGGDGRREEGRRSKVSLLCEVAREGREGAAKGGEEEGRERTVSVWPCRVYRMAFLRMS